MGADYINYTEYQELGYSAIPEDEFARYADMAVKSVSRFFAQKVICGSLGKDNMRGICEAADLYYREENQSERRLAGFANDTYREQYFEGESVSFSERLWDIVSMYFTREQLYRGV